MQATRFISKWIVVWSAMLLLNSSAPGAELNTSKVEETTAQLQAKLASYHQRIQALENRLDDDQDFQSGSNCVEEPHCESVCPTWFASGEFLLWNVERNDLAFAILDPAGLGVPAAGQTVQSLDLGGAPGFRGAIGRRTPSGWELDLKYTHLRSDDGRVFAPGGGQVLAVLSSPATGLTNANSVTATSEFRYDVVDLEAGHWTTFGDSFAAGVQGGVRIASIQHRLRAQYDGGQFVNGVIAVPTTVDAVGGRLGGLMQWNMCDNISLFGSTALSLCAAEIESRRQEVNAGAVVIDSRRITHPITPVAEFSVGIRWVTRVCSLSAGYELTNWFNVVSPLEFTDNFNGGTIANTQSDLGLHGLVVNATFTF